MEQLLETSTTQIEKPKVQDACMLAWTADAAGEGETKEDAGRQKTQTNLKKTWRQLRLVQRPPPLQAGEFPRRAQVVGVHPLALPFLSFPSAQFSSWVFAGQLYVVLFLATSLPFCKGGKKWLFIVVVVGP